MVEADIQYRNTAINKLAFGSCHKNRRVATDQQNNPIIWQAISSIEPQSFIWLGDAIYAPKKTKNSNKKSEKGSRIKMFQESIASIETLQNEYDDLLSNSTIGYVNFLRNSSSLLVSSIHGTHDDHDYGANDYGKQMPDKMKRKDLFLTFLRSSNEQLKLSHHDNHSNTHYSKDRYESFYQKVKQRSNGLYSSIEYTSSSSESASVSYKVKLILLDTRSSRDYHCPIPSIGAIKLPFNLGSPLACVTRWITAGFNLQNKLESCRNAKLLSEEQWTWLEQQLSYNNNDGDKHKDELALYVIASSIQVLTTNPTIESWGHFPNERLKLLKLLNTIKDGDGVIILSGDVHHGEILDSSAGLKLNGDWEDGDGRIIEVTSSGLTHSCIEPFYGPLCAPILEAFPVHRYESIKNYYTGRNFGTIDIAWNNYNGSSSSSNNNTAVPQLQVNVHDSHGNIVLTTGKHPLAFYRSRMTDQQLIHIVGVADGHLILYVMYAIIVAVVVSVMIYHFKRYYGIINRYKYSSMVKLPSKSTDDEKKKN